MPEKKTFDAADYASDQEVRWCPGCGDYAILKAVQRSLAQLQADPDQTVFVSGIGCSSRLPYYMSTYGFHTIHGRAPAVATGIKLANPALDLWIVTGDGDGLSIGGNHLFHILRRNVDCQLLLLNNEIYGLTKGQYSPTSRVGARTPSTPFGSLDRPANPCSFVLGAGGRFIARSFDTHKGLSDLLVRARQSTGTSFVEIYQNCIVYNADAFAPFTDKANAAERQIWLEHGQPMLFAGGSKGLKASSNGRSLEVVSLADGNWQDAGVLIHDETDRILAQMLVDMPFPDFPIALGILYHDPAPSFDSIAARKAPPRRAGTAELTKLLANAQTWSVNA